MLEVYSQARQQSGCQPRLRMDLADIGVVHFSGEVKMWHRILKATSSGSSEDQRREVIHELATMATMDMDDKDGGNWRCSFCGAI